MTRLPSLIPDVTEQRLTPQGHGAIKQRIKKMTQLIPYVIRQQGLERDGCAEAELADTGQKPVTIILMKHATNTNG